MDNTHIHHFKTWLKRLGYSDNTIIRYTSSLTFFIKWLTGENITHSSQITHETLLHYKSHLEKCKNQNTGRGLSQNYISKHFHVIRLFNQCQQHYGEPSFFNYPIYIPIEKTNSITFLSQQEIKQLYHESLDNITGYRDRAILSLLYGCGLRINEATALLVEDINHAKEVLYVRAAKNYKSRYVPMSTKVKQDLQHYAQYSRSLLLGEQENKSFLLSTKKGRTLKSCGINYRLKILAQRAGLQKRIHAHILRHSIATHLLQEGMPLEDIQHFLGHNSIESTEKYAQAKFSNAETHMLKVKD